MKIRPRNHCFLPILCLIFLTVANGSGAANYSIQNPHPNVTKTPDGLWHLHDMDRPWPENVFNGSPTQTRPD